MDEGTRAAAAPGAYAASPLALRLAWATVVLMLLVTTASAWLRLAQPRADCADWPQCRSVRAVSAADAPPAAGSHALLAAGVAPARALHRLAATLVLLLAVWLTVSSATAGSTLQAARWSARCLLGTALALAALGLAAGASRSPVVVAANQAGGFVMLGLAWVIVRRLRGAAALPRSGSRWLALLALAWLVQAALGAVSGVGTLAAGLLHLASATLVLPLTLHAALQATKCGAAAEGRALLGLLLAQVFAGALAAAYAAPAVLVLLHNVVAALGFALVAGLADAAKAAKPQTQV